MLHYLNKKNNMKKKTDTLILRLLNLFGILFFLTLITGCGLFYQNKDYPSKSDNSTPFRTTYNTPKNLHLVKQELSAYCNTGRYEAGLNQVGDAAMKDLLKCQNTPGKLAIVFDIDDTALSNQKYYIETDFEYNPASWTKWIESGSPSAIKPTLALFNQAKKQNIVIFFITGGKENRRKYYTNNLKKAGYDGWTKLIMAPTDIHYKSAEEFKAPQRKKISEEGYNIIINIGDQLSDLIGGYAGQTFKYPNPFYYIS